MKSRQNKLYSGLDHIVADIQKLGLEDFFIDGELVYKNEEGLSDSDAFQKGCSIAMSTTGYATGSFNDWSESALAVMILLMVIGGGLGSTAGGIKLARVCILMKNLVRNIRKKMVPDRTVLLSVC